MLYVKRDHAKPPAGGHRFPEGNTFLKAETVDELLIKIEEHRAENALELGFPEEDLGVYYQKIAPYLVKESPGVHRTKGLHQLVAERIMLFWREHPKQIADDSPLIGLRQNVCNECPLMGEYPKGCDRPYCTVARQRAKLLTSDREFENGGFCKWSNLPLALINRLGDVDITEWEGLPLIPKVCWLDKI